MSVRRSGKPTLSDVAARAGVSTTTASYILNGRTAEMRISADTEGRVRLAATELSYRPNRSARSLRTASTAMIGLVSDFIASGHVASHLLNGANAAARELDHLVVIGESEGRRDVEEQFIEDMLERQVDGIIYATLAARAVSAPSALRGQRAVLLNCIDREADLPSVMPDDVLGGRVAADALLAAGCTDGIYVVGEDPSDTVVAGPARLEGVHAALGAAGVPLAGVVACEWAVTSAYDAVSAWLETSPSPQGLICLNDRIAMGAYQALADRGLVIPDDLAVVSFDGSELAGWLRPKLVVGRAALRGDGPAGRPHAHRPVLPRAPRAAAADGARTRRLAARGRRPGRVDTRSSVTGVTSLRIVRHVPAGGGSNSTWQQ